MDAETGKIAANYQYGAWGEKTSVKTAEGYGDLGTANPFRYRGYYWDEESGLYYLNSRYYSPELCRFISADSEATLLATPTSISDKNLFAYCDNNPVDRSDDGGQIWTAIGAMFVGGIIGAAINAAASIITQKAVSKQIDWEKVGKAAVSGFLGGAVTASPLKIGGQVAFNSGISVVDYATECKANNVDMQFKDVAFAATIGGVSGALGGKGANSDFALSKAVQNTNNAISREARRANQKYAQKAISAATTHRNEVLVNAALGGSWGLIKGSTFSYAAGWLGDNI